MYVHHLGYIPEIGLRLFPDKIAICQGKVDLTYAQLEVRTNRVGNALRGLGIRKGERVALLFSNDWRFVEAIFGTMRAGAVAVPINVRLGYDSLRHILIDSGARILIASPDMRELAERLMNDCPSADSLVVPGASASAALDYEEWLFAASDKRPSLAAGPDDLCMMLYTSGSTGWPKGVRLHHAGQIHNADVMRCAYMLNAEERTLVSGPLYHANALSGSLFPFLLAGGSVVILPRFDPIAVIRAIEHYRCTHMTGVPAMYKLILREREVLAQHDISSLRFLSCGSAPVTQELLTELTAAFGYIDVIESYGLTEGGPVVTVNPRWGGRKLGSCGIALPGVEVRLSADAGGEVRSGEAGEVWVRSPGNARGYHNLSEVTRQRFTTDGWLKTGDVMRRDADGYYYFLGRKDDMINVGGENVYPKEVEAILLCHPAVVDVCVVAVPHQLKGQVPVAFVVTNGSTAVGEDGLKRFFLEHGPAYAHPRRVFVVDELPLSGTGKIDRAVLAKRAREAIASTPS